MKTVRIVCGSKRDDSTSSNPRCRVPGVLGGLSRGGKTAYASAADGEVAADRRKERRPSLDERLDLQKLADASLGIAFSRGDRGGNSQIFLMNADGSDQRQLTRVSGHNSVTTWLPDGTIAFSSHRTPRDSAIYVANTDGSGLRNITRELRLDAFPVWSPDGQRIAFTRDDGIYVMNADGSGERRLVHVPEQKTAPGWAPAWSPDGRKLAYGRKRGEYSDIHVVSADGSGQRRLTQRGVRPRWSADGRKIGFTSWRDGNPEIYVMNADGRGQKRLTHTPSRAELSLVWSPALTK